MTQQQTLPLRSKITAEPLSAKDPSKTFDRSGHEELPTIYWSSTWRTAIVLVILGVAALWVDLPLARYCMAKNLPGVVREFFERGESYGHACGVILISFTVLFVTKYGWRQAWQLSAIALAAGIAADVVKILFFRIRPCRMDPAIVSIRDTFLGFLPWRNGMEQSYSLLETSYHSLPSAHVATAVALSCCLTTLFPRGRWWFLALAALTAGNRIDGGAHFLSDTLWGAALGWIVGQYGVHLSHRLSTSQQTSWHPTDELAEVASN
ncbi:MAG: phosphatase PAP2 family protein [Planctomycetota bacterium]|nr:phosphatase PAP2 family protein [Planctomycetota bacterium]MDA1177249.1 phosphatase PAP2 family protein [Planctomycetota bacterium]